MSILQLVNEEVVLPEVKKYDVKNFWDKEEIEWIDDETIALHGLNEGKQFNVVVKPAEETIYITPPIPQSVEWHRLTNWRHAEELYEYYRDTWCRWKRESAIPYQVILRVEEKYE